MILTFLFFSLNSLATVVIAPLEFGPNPKWIQEAQVSVQLEQGNVQMSRRTLGLRSTRYLTSQIFHLEGQDAQGESRKVRDVNRQIVLGRFIQKFRPFLDGEIFAQIQADEFLLLQRRSVIGSGLRVQALQKNWISIYFGTGLLAEAQQFKDLQLEERLRVSTYTSGQIPLSESLSIGFTFYHQPDLFDASDLRNAHSISLTSQMTEHLSLQFSVTDRYYSNAPETTRDWDSSSRIDLRLLF